MIEYIAVVWQALNTTIPAVSGLGYCQAIIGTGAAIVASVLIGAGASAAAASRGRNLQSRLRQQQQVKERELKVAKVREGEQARSRLQVQSRLAKSAVRRAQNVQLRGRGIAPLGAELSEAVLNEKRNT